MGAWMHGWMIGEQVRWAPPAGREGDGWWRPSSGRKPGDLETGRRGEVRSKVAGGDAWMHGCMDAWLDDWVIKDRGIVIGTWGLGDLETWRLGDRETRRVER